MNWYNFCKKICEMTLFHDPQGPKIGGSSKIVEIDKNKFEKSEYH